MPKKGRIRNRKGARLAKARRMGRTAKTRRSLSTTQLLDAVGEEVHIMLPELAARLAAVEHLLIEKGVCSYEDLGRAREFVDIRMSRG